jgi:hypothetical protein
VTVILFSIVVSSTNELADMKAGIKDNENPETISEAGITAKVYVKMPNFEVLDKKNSDIITLIKDAEIPESYEGTLLKLKSEDLADIKEVIANLKIRQVVMYKDDVPIAEELAKYGVNVVLN